MSASGSRPASKSWRGWRRAFALAGLGVIAWFGRRLSKMGPVGQRIYRWALTRAEEIA